MKQAWKPIILGLGWIVALIFALGTSGYAEDKYPLIMKAVFTRGHSVSLHKGEMYHSGDYDCTPGDEHNAPDCRTTLEWAKMEAMAGTPDTIAFTMADGSRVGIQSPSINKIPGFLECHPFTEVIFCHLYFKFLGRQEVSVLRKNAYGQTEVIPTEEREAAQKALHQQLFGDGDTMTLEFRYKLVGKVKDGFQRIEIDKSSCQTKDHTNNCEAGLTHRLNPRGDGYVVAHQ